MSLMSEHIIPGNYGKIFSTNAEKLKDLEKIKHAILKIDGIKTVILNMDVFPKEFTVHTSKLTHIDTIEDEVKRFGFHAIPKALFELS